MKKRLKSKEQQYLDITSEERLRLTQFTIDHLSEAAFWIGPDARFHYVNNAACRALGYSRKELLSMRVHDIDPLFTKKVWPSHWKELKRRKSFTIESVHRRKNGSTFPVGIHINYLKYGEKEYNFAFTRDITEHKKQEEALQESEEKYRRLVKSANDAIFLANPETSILLDANQKAVELIGRPIKDIIGMHQMDLHPKEDREMYKEIFAKDASRSTSFNHTAFVVHKDGRHIPVQISAALITLKGKKVLMGIFSDITELKDIEDRLRKDKNSLQHIVAEKTKGLTVALKELEDRKRLADIGTLAATVAHELRNPLGVIRTAVYNIHKKKKGKRLDSHLANIDKKIAESDRIINNLLTYSKIKMPRYKQLYVCEVLEDCIKACKDRFKEVKVVIDRGYSCKKDCLIEFDRLHLTELFNNILNNAYQSFKTKKGRIKIKLDFNKRKKMLKLNFKDNGIGIESRSIEKIFEPFYTTKAKGIGLGLTICKQIVVLHNGTISIESQKQKGTTVSVTLPIKKS
ncbi:MAG: PAS domain S-box protein [Candidatus Omnitrophica bacterium]|nr:PAS domain S-box protein [Candidatus Omnitrophota bacterium]